jgi:5-(carboxyamino)imidazole ribonucleotide synthase
MSSVIAPGSTIGILGAGQLGRMLAISARQMGYRVAVFGGDRTSPCGQVSDTAWTGSYTDEDLLREFSTACDVVTYEFENIPALTAAAVSTDAPLRPGVELLRTAQNRFLEKTALAQLGLGTARFRMVSSAEELTAARDAFSGAVILKANTDGYDGKGQWSIGLDDDIAAIWKSTGLNEAIVEERISFEYELSVIGGRYADGTCSFFAPSLNHHENHILDVSISGATQVTAQIANEASEMTRAVLEHFDVVGVLCMELFLTTDGRLLVNEIAPRPHNSGHLTIEAYNCSQFELQLRTICNLPAVPLTRRAPAAAMANLLGQHLPEVWNPQPSKALSNVECHLHLYGKPDARANRKMGHLTLLHENAVMAENLVRELRGELCAANS